MNRRQPTGAAVNPHAITVALDARGLYGPDVDIACGTTEPAVDQWESNWRTPSREQVAKLADLTGFPVEHFYRHTKPPTAVFVCGPRRAVTEGNGPTSSRPDEETVLDQYVGTVLERYLADGAFLIHLDTVYVLAVGYRDAGRDIDWSLQRQRRGARARLAARRGDEYVYPGDLDEPSAAQAAARRRWGPS